MNDGGWLINLDSGARGIRIPQAIEIAEEAEIVIILVSLVAVKDFVGAEASGFCRVLREGKSGRFSVSDVVIPNQTGRLESTTILGETMDLSFEELERQGKNPLEYNLWWHSHGAGPVYFSPKDNRMINNRMLVMLNSMHAGYMARGEEIPSEVLVGPFFSLVANIRKEMKARCDFLYRKDEEKIPCSFYVPLFRPFSRRSHEEQIDLLGLRLGEVRKLVEGCFLRGGRQDD